MNRIRSNPQGHVALVTGANHAIDAAQDPSFPSVEHVEHPFSRLTPNFGRSSGGSGATGKWSELLAMIFGTRTAPSFQGDQTVRSGGVRDSSATFVEMLHTHVAHFEAYRPALDAWMKEITTGVIILDWGGDRHLARDVIRQNMHELRQHDTITVIQNILRTPSRRAHAQELLSASNDSFYTIVSENSFKQATNRLVKASEEGFLDKLSEWLSRSRATLVLEDNRIEEWLYFGAHACLKALLWTKLYALLD